MIKSLSMLGGGLFVSLALLAGTVPAKAQFSSTQPEGASGWTRKTLVKAQRHMIVTAHPAASEAGRDILRAGGSAVDAAIAAQLVLNLVEPQSSGIGGGAFLMHFAGTQVQAFDGRESASGESCQDGSIWATRTHCAAAG